MVFSLPFIIFFNKNLFYTGTLLRRAVTSNPANISNRYNNITVYVISGTKGLISIRITRGKTGIPGLNTRTVQSRDYREVGYKMLSTVITAAEVNLI